MHTSGLRSAVPPNQAATRPDFVSAMVEAWHEGNGAVWKMNSDFTIAGSSDAMTAVLNMPRIMSERQRTAAVRDVVATFNLFVRFIRRQNDICRCRVRKWRGHLQNARLSRFWR